jgi:hypothetical protein
MERWTDPAAKGWHCGENHIHANYGYGQWYCTPDEMRRMVEAEGLDVANFVVAQLRHRRRLRPRVLPRAARRRLGPGPVLYWNQEFRATLWGHMTLVNLRQLVEPIMHGIRRHDESLGRADQRRHRRPHPSPGRPRQLHPSGANPAIPYLSAYSAKSLPVDVALGRSTASTSTAVRADACRSGTAPQLRVPHPGVGAARTASSTGSSSGLPGASRATSSRRRVLLRGLDQGLKAGRTFVTNGPMLEFASGADRPARRPGEFP